MTQDAIGYEALAHKLAHILVLIVAWRGVFIWYVYTSFFMQGGKPELRRVPVPPHRFTPLKENWMKVFTPVVEHLKLQIRLNLKSKNVEIRVSEFMVWGGWGLGTTCTCTCTLLLYMHVCVRCM